MKNKFQKGQWVRLPGNFHLRKHRGYMALVVRVQGNLLTLECHGQEFDCTADEIGAKRALNTQQRWDIMNRDRFRCQLCGVRAGPTRFLVLDHRQSFDEGGATSPENLWTVCTDCNTGKGSRSIYEPWQPPRVATTELNSAGEVLERLREQTSDAEVLAALEVVRRAFEELHGM